MKTPPGRGGQLESGEENPILEWRDGVLVYVGTVEDDLENLVRRHREERLEKLMQGGGGVRPKSRERSHRLE